MVDDEEGPRQSIRMVFRHDYTIHLAGNGEQAMEIAASQPIDIAVVDIRMSGMSGIAVLKGLKRLDPNTEVIILTAYETLDTARQALRLGARDYLGKPFDVETLRRAVANAAMHRKISLRVLQAGKELDRISDELAQTIAREDVTRTINQFYAGILHDINNPLTIVNCFLEMVMEKVSRSDILREPDVAHLREQLAMISRQLKVCCDISSRHLDILRRPAGATTSLNLVLGDLNELIKVHPIIRTGEVTVERLETDVTVRMSSAELTQVLLNLMINALQSSRDIQAIHLSPALCHKALDFSTLQSGATSVLLHAETFSNTPPFIKIAVADQAGGIPPDIISDIFEPYFTTKSREKGSGLGLSIVSRLVKAAGGVLHLETTFGEGSCFTLFLPIVKQR